MKKSDKKIQEQLFSNNQIDAHMQMDIPKGRTAFFPNTLPGDSPHLSLMSECAFTSHEELVNGKKVSIRSESYKAHFSQPELFYRSLADWKKEHVVGDYSFEIGKCKVKPKDRMLWLIKKAIMNWLRR